jgi:hypothetical protein
VIRESTGSYDAVFYSAAVTFTIAAVLLALAVKPKRPQRAVNTATATGGDAQP